MSRSVLLAPLVAAVACVPCVLAPRLPRSVLRRAGDGDSSQHKRSRKRRMQGGIMRPRSRTIPPRYSTTRPAPVLTSPSISEPFPPAGWHTD